MKTKLLMFAALCVCACQTTVKSPDLSVNKSQGELGQPYLGFGDAGKSRSFAHVLTLFWRYEPVDGCSNCRRYHVIVDDQDPEALYSPMAQYIEAKLSNGCGESHEVRSTALQPMGTEPWAPAVAELDIPQMDFDASCEQEAMVSMRLLSPTCLDGTRPACREERAVLSAEVPWKQLYGVPVHLGSELPNSLSASQNTAKDVIKNP